MFKRWALLAIKIALTVGFVWFLLRKTDIGAAWHAGKGIDPLMFGVALVLMLVQVYMCALRWQIVIKAVGSWLSLAKVTEIFWIGTFFGLVLPGAVGGDAIRMWKTRRAGLSLAASVNSVMLERVATVFGLILLVAVTQSFMGDRLQGVPGLWVFPALTVVGAAGIAVLTLLDRFPESFHRWKVIRAFAMLAHDTRRLFLSPLRAGQTLTVAVLGQVNMSLCVYALALGLGAHVTVLDCIVLVPPVILITTLPLSIAGVGVREMAMVQFFGLIGVPQEQALAMSVLFFIIIVLTALPGGLLWLVSKDRLEMAAKEAEV